MTRTGSTLLALLLLTAPARTAEPDATLYGRQVQAVFSRLGCNGGSCHGAVQGRNGFKLSLFGADPVGDLDRLANDAGGRRRDVPPPGQSRRGRRTTHARRGPQVPRRHRSR